MTPAPARPSWRLLIKELIIRGDLERCLVIAPSNLVEQWQDELKDKFDLTFDIVSREQIETSVTGNPFVERNRLIMRLDMAARSETLQAKLQAAPDWDLVVCDEAHRMAASLFGTEVKYTKRYKLGQLAGSRARHFMLMSATPHNGNDRKARYLNRTGSLTRFPVSHGDDLSPELAKNPCCRGDALVR
jgi:superfamily II DNA or RNA helicase